LERLREEKDEEIMILQEGMDSTIQQLSETHQASYIHRIFLMQNVDKMPSESRPR